MVNIWIFFKAKNQHYGMCIEYEVQTLMVREQQLDLKMKFLLGHNLKIRGERVY